MAIAFQAGASAAQGSGNPCLVPLDLSGGGTDRYIYTQQSALFANPADATWNAAIQSFTQIGSDIANTVRHAHYELVNPGAVNSNVSHTDAANNKACGAAWFTGVHQTTPSHDEATGTGSDATLELTVLNVVTGDFVIAGYAWQGNVSFTSFDSGQTQSWAHAQNGGSPGGRANTIGGHRSGVTGSVAMNITIASSANWISGGIAITEAAGAAPASLIYRPRGLGPLLLR